MKTANDLRKEFSEHAKALELQIDCPSDGPINAKMAVVSEYPGAREAAAKRPLVGGAGKLLWESVMHSGYKRMDFFVTNVFKRQIHVASSTRAAFSRAEQDHWQNLLHWELSQLPNLEVVIVAGSIALEALLGETQINNWRGSVVKREIGPPGYEREITIIIVNNPANAIRNPSEEVIFRFHINKLKRVMMGEFREHKITPYYNYSFKQACDVLNHLYDKGIKQSIPIGYDIELLSGETACVGLALDAHEGHCFNLRTRTDNFYRAKEEVVLYRKLNAILGNPAARLVAQNGNFDSYWQWYKDRIRVAYIWHDTMLAHHLLYPRLPHDLGFLCSQYTDHPFYKDQRVEWREGGNINSFWEYNIKDCCITLAASEKLRKELDDAGLSTLFHTHVMRAQRHLVKMTVMGVPIDVKLQQTLAATIGEEVATLLLDFHGKVHDATGDDSYSPNPGSPTQMQQLYFGKLKLVGKGLSTNASNRARMAKHPRTRDADRDVLNAHNKWATESKFLTTYANMRVDPDRRIRCEYKQTGVQSAPGRLSSAAVMWGSGMNLQNQPERAKQMFVLPSGYVFCYFDLSQAEARVVAYLARIQQWIEDFERARIDGSYDCHRALAAQMYRMKYEDTPATDFLEDGTKTVRFHAKRCRHGLNYRMQAPRLAETASISLNEAYRNYNMYHDLHPEIRTWWEETTQEMINNKVLYSPHYGRRLPLMERISDEALESIIAFKPQSCIGDKVVEVIYRSEEDPHWPTGEARVALNVHDSLTAIAKKRHAKTVLQIMKKYAEQPLDINGEQLIIPAEVAISVRDETNVHRWSNLKKVKNLDEL